MLVCRCFCHCWPEANARACRHAEQFMKAHSFNRRAHEFVGVSVTSEVDAFLACTLCQGCHSVALLTPKPPRREVTPWIDETGG